MALTIIESLALWGIPVLTILITFGYYFYWGKEADESGKPPERPERVTEGGER